MKEELVEMREAGKSSTLFHEAVSYVATMCTTLMDRHCFDPAEWGTCFTPFLGPFVGGVAKQACEYALRPRLPGLNDPPVRCFRRPDVDWCAPITAGRRGDQQRRPAQLLVCCDGYAA